EVGTAVTGATLTVCDKVRPYVVWDRLRELVAVAVPFAALEFVGEVLKDSGVADGVVLLSALVVVLAALQCERALPGVLDLVGELGDAGVAGSTLGYCEREVDGHATLEGGRVLERELLLKLDGGGGDDDALAARAGNRERGGEVAHGLAD